MRTRLLSLLMIVLASMALAACGAASAPASSGPASAPAVSNVKPMGEMSVTDLKTKLDASESMFLLDVRTPEEFTQDGHVAQATLIPLNELSTRLGELPTDQPIVCICRSGNRSTQACSDLAARGYDATNVAGGMNAWKSAGLPVAGP